MKPRNARNDDAICRLSTDHWDGAGHWMLLGPDTVTIAAQRPGEPATAMVKISRRTLEAMLAWYDRDQPGRP